MIKYYKRSARDSRIKEIANFEKGCWINAVSPSVEELKKLQEDFNLDEQNLLSAIDKHEIPRAEFEKEGDYIILKTIHPEDNKEIMTFMIVLGTDYLLTISKNQPKFITDVINNKKKIVTLHKLKTLLQFLSEINDEFEKAALNIVKTVDRTKDSILELRDKDITALLEQEDALNNFVSAYTYSNRVYERMMKKIRFSDDDDEMLEDLIIEGKEIHGLCINSLKTISNIRSHFEILMSNKLNRVLTLLTVFTILISIPAAISSIYGMNINLPLQQNPMAFYYIIAFIVLSILVLLIYFKKKKVII